MLYIRKAEPEDLEEIAQVHTDAWLAAYKHIFSARDLARGSLDARRSQWRERLAQKEHGHYVAAEQGDIVGFFTLAQPQDKDLPEGTLELEAIYFSPAQWRKGYGTQCLSFIMSQAREGGKTHISLWVLRDNHSAAAFYEKIGFYSDGCQRPVGPGSEVLENRWILAL